MQVLCEIYVLPSIFNYHFPKSKEFTLLILIKQILFTEEYWFQNLQILFLLIVIYQKYLGRWKP